MRHTANIPQIPLVRQGDKITANQFNELAKAINIIGRQRPQEIFSIDDGGGGTQCTQLKPSLSGTDVSITAGFIGSEIPKIGTTPLDNDPAPTLTTAEGHTIYLQIELTWEVTGSSAPYTLSGSYTIDDIKFVSSDTDPENIPTFDDQSSSDVMAIHTLAWAGVAGTNPNLSLSAQRCGNHQIINCDPLKILLAPEAITG